MARLNLVINYRNIAFTGQELDPRYSIGQVQPVVNGQN
jgi:hypothetical protein